MGLVALKEGEERDLFLSSYACTKERPCVCNKKVATCKPETKLIRNQISCILDLGLPSVHNCEDLISAFVHHPVYFTLLWPLKLIQKHDYQPSGSEEGKGLGPQHLMFIISIVTFLSFSKVSMMFLTPGTLFFPT